MTEYFPHEFHSRHRPAIQRILRNHGMAGYGIYWCVIEAMHENGGALTGSDIESLEYDIRTDQSLIISVMRDAGMIDDGGTWRCSDVDKNISLRAAKKDAARKASAARWNATVMHPQCTSNASAMRDECASNAIKEKKRKEKEIKGKEIKGNKIKANETDRNAPAMRPQCDSNAAASVPEHLSGIWEEYASMRKKINKPLTEKAIELTLRELERLSPDPRTQVKILEQSIQRGWQGVFPLREEKTGFGRDNVSTDDLSSQMSRLSEVLDG